MYRVFVVFLILAVLLSAGFYSYQRFKAKKAQVVSVKPSEFVLKLADTQLALDEEGFVVDVKDDNLPILFSDQNKIATKGQKLEDETISFSLALTQNLIKSDFNPVNVRILSPAEIVVYNNLGSTAIFSAQKQLNSQLDSLQAVLAQAKIDANKITRIDLRFDKPVVVYKK